MRTVIQPGADLMHSSHRLLAYPCFLCGLLRDVQQFYIHWCKLLLETQLQ